MSQTPDKTGTKAVLHELKDKLKSGTSQSTALLQALEDVESGLETLTGLENALPQLASDISDETNQKKAQKRLLELARTFEPQLEQQRNAGFGVPEKGAER